MLSRYIRRHVRRCVFATWNGVAIQIFHHPDHMRNLDRMTRGVQASLSDYSEKFGPYPYHELRLIEAPGSDVGLHADTDEHPLFGRVRAAQSGRRPAQHRFPLRGRRARWLYQWWGNRAQPAPVEGAPETTESLAWYSAIGVVERTYGAEHVRRFLDALREAYLSPNARADVPLLRADDWFSVYRKGPFAM